MTCREKRFVRSLNKYLIVFLALVAINVTRVNADDAFLTVKPAGNQRSDYQPVCRMGNLGWPA